MSEQFCRGILPWNFSGEGIILLTQGQGASYNDHIHVSDVCFPLGR